MSDTESELDLEMFCSRDAQHLATPWSEGAYSYFADSSLIIRVPRRPSIPERADAPKSPSVSALFSGCAGEAKKLPAYLPCDEPTDAMGFAFEGTYLSNYYLTKISKLPGIELAIKADGKHPATQVFIFFRGGQGVLMAMLPPKEATRQRLQRPRPPDRRERG
jgi:hypothetical protein